MKKRIIISSWCLVSILLCGVMAAMLMDQEKSSSDKKIVITESPETGGQVVTGQETSKPVPNETPSITQRAETVTVEKSQLTEKPTELPTEKPTKWSTERPIERVSERPAERPTVKPTEKPAPIPTRTPLPEVVLPDVSVTKKPDENRPNEEKPKPSEGRDEQDSDKNHGIVLPDDIW